MNTDLIERLLPCPFCGCEASIYSADSDGPHWVQCDMCKARADEAEYQEHAVMWWNNRYSALTQADARIARLEEALRDAGAFLKQLERQGEDNLWRPAKRIGEKIDTALKGDI